MMAPSWSVESVALRFFVIPPASNFYWPPLARNVRLGENSAWIVRRLFALDKPALGANLRSAAAMLVIRSDTGSDSADSERANFHQATCRPRLVSFRQRTHLPRCRPTRKRLWRTDSFTVLVPMSTKIYCSRTRSTPDRSQWHSS